MNHHCDIQIQACTTEDTRGLWGPNINRLQWGNFNKQIFLFNFFMEMQMEMAQIINVVCRFKFAQIKSPGYIGSDPLWSKD